MATTIRDMSELPAILDVADIKRLFAIGQRQAYELVRSEGFPAMKVQGRIKIPKHLLMVWIEDRTKGAIANDNYHRI